MSCPSNSKVPYASNSPIAQSKVFKSKNIFFLSETSFTAFLKNFLSMGNVDIAFATFSRESSLTFVITCFFIANSSTLSKYGAIFFHSSYIKGLIKVFFNFLESSRFSSRKVLYSFSILLT